MHKAEHPLADKLPGYIGVITYINIADLANHIGSISCHITPLVINSLGGGHTHTHTNMHTDICRQSNSKKPGMRQPQPGRWLWVQDNRWNAIDIQSLVNI